MPSLPLGGQKEKTRWNRRIPSMKKDPCNVLSVSLPTVHNALGLMHHLEDDLRSQRQHQRKPRKRQRRSSDRKGLQRTLSRISP